MTAEGRSPGSCCGTNSWNGGEGKLSKHGKNEARDEVVEASKSHPRGLPPKRNPFRTPIKEMSEREREQAKKAEECAAGRNSADSDPQTADQKLDEVLERLDRLEKKPDYLSKHMGA